MPKDRNLSGCQVFEDADLPAGWECAPFGSHIELAYGRGLREDDRRPGDVDVYGSNGRVGGHDVALVNGPGILIGRKGTVGAVHYAPRPFWPIDTVYYVVPRAGDDLRFLHHLLDYLPLDFLNAATGVPGLSRRDAYALRGAFPPPNEQAAIAGILDAVDKAVERAHAKLAAAKTLAASLREEAVLGSLVTVGTRPRESSTWTHPRLGTIPSGWSVDRLGRVCERIVDGTHQAVETSSSGVPFLYVSCVRDGRILWRNASFISERTYARISKGREPQIGSVLYTAVGSYGNAALVSTSDLFSFQRHIAVLYPKTARLIGGYLALWLNSSKGRRWSEIHAVGNAQKTVTLTELAKLLIAFPPTDVQRDLCEVVSGAEAVVDATNVRLNGLADLKRALMHDLLTGRVRLGNEVKAAPP